MIEITRRLEIDAGHRVFGHEGKCASWHGHRWVIDVTCTAQNLDSVGRVIDFGVIKTRVGRWLDDHFDHAMILWDQDEEMIAVARLLTSMGTKKNRTCIIPVNPTSENLATYLLRSIIPDLLKGTGVVCAAVTIHETPNCYATARLPQGEVNAALRRLPSDDADEEELIS